MLKRCKSLYKDMSHTRAHTHTHTCTDTQRAHTHIGANIVHIFFCACHFLLSSLLSSTYTNQLQLMLRTTATAHYASEERERERVALRLGYSHTLSSFCMTRPQNGRASFFMRILILHENPHSS